MKNFKGYIEATREWVRRPLCIEDFAMFEKDGRYYNNLPEGVSDSDLEFQYVCDKETLISELKNFNIEKNENCVSVDNLEDENFLQTLIELVMPLVPEEEHKSDFYYDEDNEVCYFDSEDPIKFDYTVERNGMGFSVYVQYLPD